MKRRMTKALLSVALVASVSITQISYDYSPVFAEEINNTEDNHTETSISDDTVIASKDSTRFNADNANEDIYMNYEENAELFNHIMKYLGKEDDTDLTYGDVKEIKFYTISDTHLESLNHLSDMLPNLEELKIEAYIQSVKGIGHNVKKLTYDFDSNPCIDFENLSEAISLEEIYIYNYYSYHPSYKERIANADELSDITDIPQLDNLKSLVVDGMKAEDESNYHSSFTPRYYIIGLENWLPKFVNLEKLSLENSSLGLIDGDIKALYELPKLKELDVRGCGYLKSFPTSLSDTIESINVSYCAIEEIEDMSKYVNLNQLVIIGNPSLIKEYDIKHIPSVFADDEDWVKSNFDEGNEYVVTNGEADAKYDIPDYELYNQILQVADINSDDIVSVGEAWSVTRLDSNWMSPVSDYQGFAKVFKNLRIYTEPDYYMNDGAKDTLYTELAELENLAELTTYIATQSQFDNICKGNSMLKSWNLRNDYNHYSGEAINFKNISLQKELTKIDLSLTNITNIEEVGKLKRLSELSVNDTQDADLESLLSGISHLESLTITNLYEEHVSVIEKLSGIKTLNIRSYSSNKEISKTINLSGLTDLMSLTINEGFNNVILPDSPLNYLSLEMEDNSDEITLDLSKYNELYYINIEGYYNTVILPEKTSSDDAVNYISLIYYDSSKKGTLKNLESLSEVVSGINIYNYEIKDLSDIKQYKTIQNLSLVRVNLEDTAGIDELSNLKTLHIVGNENLTSLDAGIAKLTHLEKLILNYNSLESLPDMSDMFIDGLKVEFDEEASKYYDYDYELSDVLSLAGNNLTNEVLLSSGIPKMFTDDVVWRYDAVSRHFNNDGDIGIYYPEMSQEYIEAKLKNDYMINLITTSELTLTKSLLDHVLYDDHAMAICIADEDLKNTDMSYIIEQETLQDWDGESDIILTHNHIELSDGDISEWQPYFNGELKTVKGIKTNQIPGTKLNWKGSFELDEQTLKKGDLYIAYTMNQSTKDFVELSMKEYNGSVSVSGSMENAVVIITDIDVECSHHIAGISSGFRIGRFEETSVLEDINNMSKDFAKLIEEAENGETIYIAVKQYPMIDETHLEMAMDKDLKINATSIGDYLIKDQTVYATIYAEYRYDFSQIKDMQRQYLDINGRYLIFNANGYAGDEPPYSLYGDKLYASIYQYCDKELIIYVGGTVKNDTDIYVYELDYDNQELVEADVVKVLNGYIDLNLKNGVSRYILVAGEELTETKWNDSGEDNIMRGDINNDGIIDIKDSALLKRYLTGWDIVLDRTVADMNKDEKVNVKDSALLKRYLAGWES